MLRQPARTTAVAAACLLGSMSALWLGQVAGAAPGQPAPMEGATVTDAGWWNRARPGVDLPTGQPPPPPVPGVPEGSLVVGATTGEPDAISAVAIEPSSLPGATVSTFELTLREVPDDGANLNTPFAAIVACPITEFWFGGENGVWETRPAFDCELAEATGERADDGTWTWDLTAVGQLWSDGSLAAQGVALVEDVEAPTAFRSAFQGLADAAIGVRYEASGGAEPDDPFTGGGGFDTGGGGGFDAPVGGGDVGPVGGDSGFSLPPVATGGPAAEPAAGGAATSTTTEPPATEVASQPISNGPRSPLGTLPWWTWPLLAGLLGAGAVIMLVLGPGGEPAVATTQRGVARALDARPRTEEP